MRKIFSLLLTITIISAVLNPISAFCDNNEEWENGVLYQANILVAVKTDYEGELIIKEGTTNIEEQAFKGCKGITSIRIPASLTEIYTQEYDYCESLIEISVDENNPALMSKGGILYSKDGETVVKYPRAKKADVYTVPDTAKTIGEGAYSFAEIKKVIIPANVKNIGVHAFSYSILNTLTLKNGVETIEQLAFVNCKRLKSVKVPKSIKKIGYGAIGCYEYSQYKDDADPVLYKRHLQGKWYDDEFKVCNYSHSKFTLYGYKGTVAEKYSYGGLDENDEDGDYSYSVNFVPLDFAKPKVKIVGKKKQISIKYTKVKGASGFEVVYRKGKKSSYKLYKSKKSVTKTIKKLKKGKYKVRVRAYYVSDGHKIFSNWTKAKTVKVK